MKMSSSLRSLVALLLVAASSTFSMAQDTLPAAPPPAPEPSPLLREPKTPEELFAAILLTADLARLDLTKAYLEEFLAGDPSPDLLLKLRAEHGTAEFLRLSSIAELQPGGRDLLKKLEAASRSRASDAEYLERIIKQLAGSATDRELAITELRNIGTPAVPALVAKYQDRDFENQIDLLNYTLIRMGQQVVPPMLGALDASEDSIRAAAATVLGQLHAKEAVPFLWAQAFGTKQSAGLQRNALEALSLILYGNSRETGKISDVEAAAALEARARADFMKSTEYPLNDDGTVTVWSWNKSQQTVSARQWPLGQAQLWYATRFSREALSLSPSRDSLQALFLASLLGLESQVRGLDQPLPETPGSPMSLALTAGEPMLLAILDESLQAGQSGSALAALKALARVGTREMLRSGAGRKSPVIAALNSPSERVQFQAAISVLRTSPMVSFAGAERVVPILRRALTEQTQPRAIVADPGQGRLSVISSYLQSAGYEVQTARTGKTAFAQAASLGGVDVIILNLNIVDWELTPTMMNLRADARTTAIPVLLYGPEQHRAAVGRLVERSQPASFLAEVSTEDEFLRDFRPLLAAHQASPLTVAERDSRRLLAAHWLAEIANTRSWLFDIAPAEEALSRSANDNRIAANSLIALGGVGTHTAQKRLAEIVTNSQMPAKVRTSAANQLGQHIQRHTLLLTRADVVELHNSWKDAEDPALSTSLAAIMGLLQPNSQIVSERLQAYPWDETAQ